MAQAARGTLAGQVTAATRLPVHCYCREDSISKLSTIRAAPVPATHSQLLKLSPSRASRYIANSWIGLRAKRFRRMAHAHGTASKVPTISPHTAQLAGAPSPKWMPSSITLRKPTSSDSVSIALLRFQTSPGIFDAFPRRGGESFCHIATRNGVRRIAATAPIKIPGT